jgi:hypothetical protein
LVEADAGYCAAHAAEIDGEMEENPAELARGIEAARRREAAFAEAADGRAPPIRACGAAARRRPRCDRGVRTRRSRGPLSDERPLEAAAPAGRAILTENARDFEPLAGRCVAEAREHAGISGARRRPRTRAALPALARAVETLLRVHPEADALSGLTVRLPSPGE